MLVRRLVPWLAVVGLASVLAAGCGSDDGPVGSAGPSTTSGAPSADPGDAAVKQPVIVDLAVPRQDPAAVERAQDEVMRALGSHGTLSRRLTATAQMAVSVDEEGRRILARLPVVGRVHEDRADPPGASGSDAVPQGRASAGPSSDTSSVAPAADSVPPSTTTTVPPATTAPSSAPSTRVAAEPTGARQQVIVDLAVPAQSPAAVEAAQDEVMSALGAHGTLARRLTATAQMSVSVDAEGRRILDGHPLVARVHVDTPTGSATTN